MKRKVGGLGPLSETEFRKRLESMRLEAEKGEKGGKGEFCETCSKKFGSTKALENHMRSRRHVDRVRGAGTEIVEEEEMEVERELERRVGEGAGTGLTECVFDGRECGSVEGCLRYMAEEFGFFVPFVERLVDVEGLLRYLGQKVGVGYACVECDRGFGEVGAVRRHMVDVGHCKMCGDEELWMEEFGEFYEFEEDEEDGWEEVDGEEEEMETDVGEEVVGLAVSGKVLGHRSLGRYYGQATGQRVDCREAVVANRVLSEYRKLGWEGRKKDDVMKVKGERFRQKREKRFELLVGGRNYYTRKAQFKQSMAVFNSGYRA